METAEQAARRIVDSYVSTWNAHDLEKWSGLFAPDAEYVTPLGGLQVGRDEILQSALDTHAGWFAQSVLTDDFMTVRRIGDDGAVVLWRWMLVGMVNSRGVTVRARTGRTTLVLVREGEDWQVAAAHDADIQSAPWEREDVPDEGISPDRAA